MTKIKDATLDEIAETLIGADHNLTQFSFVVREVVPELLKRAIAATPTVTQWIDDATLEDLQVMSEAVAVALEAEASVPAEPKPNTTTPATGRDRIDTTPPYRTVVLTSGDNVMQKLGGTITDTRVIVHGEIGAIRIGGKDGLKMDMDGGTSEIVAGGLESTVRGIKLDGDPRGQLRIGNGLTVQPEANSDGTSMGDFAPIRGMGAMPNLHIVLDDIELTAPEDWTGYGGFGMKWAMWIKGCRLTMIEVLASAAREHSVYGHNVLDVWCERVENELRIIDDKPLGNGRTLLQFTNRIPGDYPKGGDPSQGNIVLKDCTARGTGWEGLIDKIGPAGELDPLNYGKGGGAAFTVAGHTGPLVRLEGCRVEMPYANGVAVYVDESPKSASPIVNPRGYRCWMFGDDGEPFDPTRDLLSPASAWATRRLEIVDYEQSRLGSRTSILVSGVQTFARDESISEPGISRLNYQLGVRAIESVEVIS